MSSRTLFGKDYLCAFGYFMFVMILSRKLFPAVYRPDTLNLKKASRWHRNAVALLPSSFVVIYSSEFSVNCWPLLYFHGMYAAWVSLLYYLPLQANFISHLRSTSWGTLYRFLLIQHNSFVSCQQLLCPSTTETHGAEIPSRKTPTL